MNYHLRSKEELYREWQLLKDREAYLRNEYSIALSDIQADKKVIELELQLLASMGGKDVQRD